MARLKKLEAIQEDFHVYPDAEEWIQERLRRSTSDRGQEP
jgi:hypothetical protein